MKDAMVKNWKNWKSHLTSELPSRAVLAVLAVGLAFSLTAQTVKVSGTVSDAGSGDVLPGVNIAVKGTGRGTVTDLDGTYALDANSGDTLVFSFIGYVSQQLIARPGQLNVQLDLDLKQLNEVVVIGYGTTTVKDATGSLTSVTAKDFNKGNIVTPENLLQGRVAGLSITTGGEPGAGSVIRIRGGASLGASNDPLIVINGLPMDNNTIGGSRSVLSTINPNDIESFTVLKDASATAIYGSRASNGVIIITTKSASRELKVNVDIQGGVNTLSNKVDVLSAAEFRELITNERPDLLPLLGDANTDWQDEIYQNAGYYNANVSVQGNLFNKIPTRVSFGRNDQDGLRLTSNFTRNSGSINLNPAFFNGDLVVSVNANGTLEKNRFASGQEGNAITFDPTQPVYDSESPFGGFFQYRNDNNDGVLDRSDLTPNAPFNPVAELLQRQSISDVRRLYGNVKLDYNFPFLRDLKAVVNLGMDDQVANGSVTVDPTNPLAQTDGSIIGSRSEYENKQRNVLTDIYGVYTKSVNALDVEVTGGYSFQRFESNRFNTNELLFESPEIQPLYEEDTDLVLLGLFTRANLTLNKNYLLTLSYRRDGTSRFSPENRWGNFPAVAFAWKIREDLMPESSAFSSLKLRLGWGVTGQQDIGRANSDLFLQRYGVGLPASQYQFGNAVIPVGVPQFRNENLKWEETTTWNAAIDYGFADDRFTGSVEYFFKESRDLLAYAAISDGSNFSNAGFQNIGNFISQGLEFALNANVVRTNDFTWDVNYNITYIRTEIKSLALNEDQNVGGIGGGTGGTVQLHRVGYEPYAFFVYKQVYNEAGKPIEGTYADLNGDNTINESDRYLFQKGRPDVTMGFLSNLSYKNFDFSFNLRSSIGNYVYNNVNSARAQLIRLQNVAVASNLPSNILETGFNITEDVILSDYYLENASFLRMDNVTMGYTFRNVGFSKSALRVSAGVQNALVWTKYSGLDPEVFDNGIDNTLHPRPRTYFMGLNYSF